MYSEILTNMDVESKDSKSSNNKNSQRAAALQGMWVCPGYINQLLFNYQNQYCSYLGSPKGEQQRSVFLNYKPD